MSTTKSGKFCSTKGMYNGVVVMDAWQDNEFSDFLDFSSSSMGGTTTYLSCSLNLIPCPKQHSTELIQDPNHHGHFTSSEKDAQSPTNLRGFHLFR